MAETGMLIDGSEWACLVLEKLKVDPDLVSRVVIDCQVGQPLKFYIEHYGTTDLLDIRPPEANECEIVVNQ
jgi:hypothetical protein